jgi:hypothetical protein
MYEPSKQPRRAPAAAVSQPAGPPPLELLRGPQPSRVSWREAHRTPPTLVLALGALVQRLLARFHTPHWWKEHDPLTVQRALLMITLLLAILVTLNVI